MIDIDNGDEYRDEAEEQATAVLMEGDGWDPGEAEAIVVQLEPQFRALARKFASR